MRAFLCICVAGLVASTAGCMSSQGYLMNQSGQTYYERGNYAQAATEFQRAVAVNPYNADYVANLASALSKQGNLPAAEQTWQHALNVNPSHQPSYHGLAQMYVETNRQNEAVALLSSWTASQPYAPEAQIEMAWLNRELGNSAGAAESLQQALAINPNHPKALAALGQYYQDNGRMAEAVTTYQQALRSNWYQPEVQSRLATLKGFESPQGTAQTQLAQGMLDFGGTPQVSMQFPPRPQFLQAAAQPQMARRMPFSNPVPQFAQQPQQFAAPPQFAQQYSPQQHVGHQHAPQQQFAQQQFATGQQQQPFMANANQLTAPAYTTNMPLNTQGYTPNMQTGIPQSAYQQPIQDFAAMPSQPAVTEYPITGMQVSDPYAAGDPFANQFVNQPYANAAPVTQPQGTFVDTVAPEFNPPAGAISGGAALPHSANAVPARAPQVSAAPELQPF